MGIRISEMEEATSFTEEDYIPIVSSGTNKKALGQKIKDFIAGFFVSKSGDTMTGNLKNTGGTYQRDASEVTVSTSGDNGVTANTYPPIATVIDSTGQYFARIEGSATTAGAVGVNMVARNMNTSGNRVSNSLQVIVNKDGTQSYFVSDPAAFRRAIEAGSADDVQRTIALLSGLSTVNQLLLINNLPTTATSYNLSDDFTNYLFLSLELRQYGNVFTQILIPSSYFDGTNAGSRPLLYGYRSSLLGMVEVYKNTTNSVYVMATEGSLANSSVYSLRIYGIGKIN